MSDTQIVRASETGVPAEYVLPGSVAFRLKAVHAEFDGSGTAAAWLPCVTVLSDSGHIIARACDPNAEVTGGGDAEVSWFPGVKNMAAAAGGGGAPDTVRLFGAGLIIPATPGGYSGESPWVNASKITTGTNIWTYTLDGSGNVVEVKASSPGVYESFFSGSFHAPSMLVDESMIANVFGTIPLADHVSCTIDNETANRWGATVGLLTSFSTGTAQFNAEIDYSNAASGVFNGDEWWIKHWAF